MEGRQYKATFDITNATSAIDLIEFIPADDKSIGIKSIFAKVTSEIQEAQEEWLKLDIIRGITAISSGLGGNAATYGMPDSAVDVTSGFSYETANTSLAGFSGGSMTLFKDAIQVRIGAEVRFTPDEYIWVNQNNGGIVVRLPNSPGDAIDIRGTVTLVELP